MKLNRIRTLLAGCLLIPAAMTQAAVNVNPRVGEIEVEVRVNIFKSTCSLQENAGLTEVKFDNLSPASLENKPEHVHFSVPFTCPGVATASNKPFYVRINGDADAPTNEYLNLTRSPNTPDNGLDKALKIRLLGGNSRSGNALKIYPTSPLKIEDEVKSGNLRWTQRVTDSTWTEISGNNVELKLTAELSCRQVSGGPSCNNLPPGTVSGSAFITMEYF